MDNTNFLHFGGGNLLFADGHVKWQFQNSISPRQYGLNSDVVTPVATGGMAIDTNQISF